MVPPPQQPHLPRHAHSPHGPYCSLGGQHPPSAHAHLPNTPNIPNTPIAARAPDPAVGGAGAASQAGEENGPATYAGTHTPSPGAYTHAPGPATLCLTLAALALLAAAACAARAAPDALRLLAVLNLSAALRLLGPSLLCAASGVAAATLALLLASVARSATPDADVGLPQADGRTWAVLRLERALHARRRRRWVEG
jgi:hypothetical protein